MWFSLSCQSWSLPSRATNSHHYSASYLSTYYHCLLFLLFPPLSVAMKVIITDSGVKIIGYTNLPSRLATTSSNLYGNKYVYKKRSSIPCAVANALCFPSVHDFLASQYFSQLPRLIVKTLEITSYNLMIWYVLYIQRCKVPAISWSHNYEGIEGVQELLSRL